MKKVKNYKTKVFNFIEENRHLSNKNRYVIMERLLFNDGLIDYKDGTSVFIGDTVDVLRAVVTYDRCIRDYFKDKTDDDLKKELSEPYRREFRSFTPPNIQERNADAAM